MIQIEENKFVLGVEIINGEETVVMVHLGETAQSKPTLLNNGPTQS